jgi:ABC-type polysaccharide/polyol phosphate export permease
MVSKAVIESYREIWKRRNLVAYLVEAQLQASVHKNILGKLWFSLVPLSQIGIYYLLVVVIFSAGPVRPATSFIAIAMGIMHYMVLNNVATYCQSAIHSNASLLLEVKLEPIVLIAASFLRAIRISGFGILLFFIFFVFWSAEISNRILIYPFILLLWLALCWVTALCVATASVFLRDLERLVPILLQVTMYTSPVIYSFNLFPDKYITLFLLNPVASVFTLFQWSLLGLETDISLPLVIVISWVLAGFFGAHAFYNWGRNKFTKVL